jgi:hypothetical protein
LYRSILPVTARRFRAQKVVSGEAVSGEVVSGD